MRISKRLSRIARIIMEDCKFDDLTMAFITQYAVPPSSSIRITKNATEGRGGRRAQVARRMVDGLLTEVQLR